MDFRVPVVRLDRIFAPLLCVVDRDDCRSELRDLARAYHHDLIADRGMDIEAQVLQIIRHSFAYATRPAVTVKDITRLFVEHYGREYEQKITNKWIGGIIRRKLNLNTHKSNGVYSLPLTEQPKLELLYERYGISSDDIPDGNNLSEELELIFEPEDKRDARNAQRDSGVQS